MFKLSIGTKKSISISKADKIALGEISASRVTDYPDKILIHLHINNTDGMRVQNVRFHHASGTQQYVPICLFNSENAWELALTCKWLAQRLFATSNQVDYES